MLKENPWTLCSTLVFDKNLYTPLEGLDLDFKGEKTEFTKGNFSRVISFPFVHVIDEYKKIYNNNTSR